MEKEVIFLFHFWGAGEVLVRFEMTAVQANITKPLTVNYIQPANTSHIQRYIISLL